MRYGLSFSVRVMCLFGLGLGFVMRMVWDFVLGLWLSDMIPLLINHIEEVDMFVNTAE